MEDYVPCPSFSGAADQLKMRPIVVRICVIYQHFRLTNVLSRNMLVHVLKTQNYHSNSDHCQKLPSQVWGQDLFFLKNTPNKKKNLEEKTKTSYRPWLSVIDSLMPTPWKTFTLHEARAIGKANAAGNRGVVIINHFPFLGDSGMVHIKQ